MTKLQQRKDAIAKEMREIEILEKMENERNSESEKIKLISRLLLDLHDQPLACGLPIGTVAHVKMIFDASCETCTTCYFANTCEEIVSLTSKSKRKNSRKLSGKSSKIATVKVTFTFSKNTGICEITEPIKIPAFHASEWLNSDTRKALRQSLVKENGLTSNQLAGISKNFNAMGYKMGHIDWD